MQQEEKEEQKRERVASLYFFSSIKQNGFILFYYFTTNFFSSTILFVKGGGGRVLLSGGWVFLSRCGSAAFGLRWHLILPIFLGTQDRAMIGCVRGGIQKGVLRFRGRGEGKKESSFM